MADVTYSGNAAVVDGTAAAAGTGPADIIGGVYNDAIATVGSGNAGMARITQYRALHVNLREADGTEVGTGIQYVEDTAITADAGQGTLVVARRDDVLSTLTPAQGDAVGLRVDSLGALWVTEARRASTATTSNVASSASSTTLLSANADRLGAMILNDSDEILYVKLGATASTTSFTVKMESQTYYEVPFDYTGIIDGIWAAADGFARVTEVEA
jgi:hypothetical protein